MRTDITIDRKQVSLPLRGQMGYMKYKAQFGDVVFFRESPGHITVGRMIGRIARGRDYDPPTGTGRSLVNHIVVLCLGSTLDFTMERWVDPQDVEMVHSSKTLDLSRRLGYFFGDEWLKKYTTNEMRERQYSGDFFEAFPRQ